jgi:hypothetical protein
MRAKPSWSGHLLKVPPLNTGRLSFKHMNFGGHIQIIAPLKQYCFKNSLFEPGVVDEAYNPSCLGNKDQEDHSLRPVWAKSDPILTNDWASPVIPGVWEAHIGLYSGWPRHKVRPSLKNNIHKKGWWGGRIKENGGGGKCKQDMFDIL